MKVAAIMYSSNRYFYNKRETSFTTVKSKVVKEDIIFTKNTDDKTDNNPVQSNTAEYVKHAYEVSFKPLEMIVNLQ